MTNIAAVKEELNVELVQQRKPINLVFSKLRKAIAIAMLIRAFYSLVEERVITDQAQIAYVSQIQANEKINIE